MFDIGFTEIIVICLVGLVVIGPTRLPDALRAGAMWMGRAKRMIGNVRRDLENEIGIDEIRRDLRNEQIMSEIKAENLEEERERLQEERNRLQKEQQAISADSGADPQTQMQPLPNKSEAEAIEEGPRKSRLSKRKPHVNSYLDSSTKNGIEKAQNVTDSPIESSAQTTTSKSKE